VHIPPTYGSTIAKLDSNSTRRPNNSRSVAELPANLDLARSNRLRKGLLARQLARVNFGANMVRDLTKMLGGLHYEC
jgi:hypothetical protein